MSTDNFAEFGPHLNSPGTKSTPITPDDNNDLAAIPRGIFVGTGGTITLMLRDDTTPRVFKNVASGCMPSWRVRRVCATGTTAADMLAIE